MRFMGTGGKVQGLSASAGAFPILNFALIRASARRLLQGTGRLAEFILQLPSTRRHQDCAGLGSPSMDF